MEDTIAEKLLTIAENEQNVFNAGYEKGLASGGVTINNQDKTITENGVYQADEGYTGLGTVTVEVASTGGGDIDALIDGSITELTSNVIKIKSRGLYACAELTTINFPNATYIGEYAFSGCGALLVADFPNVTTLGNYTFENCNKLTTANFPNATSISSNAFRGCWALQTINFLNAITISGYAFQNCGKLATVNFPKVTKIDNQAFGLGYSLKTVILRVNQVATLSNVNAFNGCCHIHGTADATYNPQGLKDGYIYVPKDLVESYKTATNWSTYATQFRALEDYTVDGTITGELDESKI
jgi:hypothetical protein